MMTVQQKEICTFAGLSSFLHDFPSILQYLLENDEQMMTVQQQEICTFAGLSSFSHHFPSCLQYVLESDEKMMTPNDAKAINK